jgi:hypothetical protein
MSISQYFFNFSSVSFFLLQILLDLYMVHIPLSVSQKLKKIRGNVRKVIRVVQINNTDLRSAAFPYPIIYASTI